MWAALDVSVTVERWARFGKGGNIDDGAGGPDMGETDFAGVAWRKSSSSGATNCVEVAMLGESILVRDSKQPTAGYLAFSASEWCSFVEAVKHGEFDQPG